MRLNVYDEFRLITKYNIEKYFRDFSNFISINYSDIVNYYNGSDISQDAFNKLDELDKESQKIEGLLQFYSKSFLNSEYWELFDKFSDTQVKISTIKNLSRWMRSSRANRFSSEVSIDYILKQNESIEKVSKKSGSELYENEWYKIAIDNDLNEEKYTSEGGNILSVKLSNKLNFTFRNIVDTLSKENLYGKDIKKKFTLENGDIVCLQGLDSLMQTFETIFETFKGSIPEFPEDGLSNFVIGSNVNVIGYQYIFRNIIQMFQKDDRFKSVELIDLQKVEDQIYLKVQARTKINEFIPKEILL